MSVDKIKKIQRIAQFKKDPSFATFKLLDEISDKLVSWQEAGVLGIRDDAQTPEAIKINEEKIIQEILKVLPAIVEEKIPKEKNIVSKVREVLHLHIPDPIKGDPGKDAVVDEKEIVEKIVKKIKLPKQIDEDALIQKIMLRLPRKEDIIKDIKIEVPELVQTPPKEIARSLESLSGAERLDYNALKNRPGIPTYSQGKKAKGGGGGGDGGGGHTIQDESVSLTQRTKLNFLGAGVEVTDNPGDDSTDVTITGGGAGNVATDAIWDAAGDLAVGTGSNTAARLAKGTSREVLSVNEAGTALEWVAGTGLYNVADYGATGDGTTDDTAAIQACIDDAPDGSTIMFTKETGIYKITSTLLLESRYMLTLESHSTAMNGSPQFKWAGANNGVMLGIYDSYFCKVKGFTFVTTTGTTVDKAIDIDTVSGFSSNHFLNFIEINFANQANSSLRAISIDESGSSNNENMQIENVRILGSSSYARLYGSDDGVMTIGSPTLTMASAPFAAGDVGKVVRVGKAGTAGATLLSTISAFVSSSEVTLADNAVASVAQARVHVGSGLGTGIYNGNNANAKHQIFRNVQIVYCDTCIENVAGSVIIQNFGGGYSNLGFKNSGQTEPVVLDQMVTEGLLVEVDQAAQAGRLYMTNCRGSNTWQLTDYFYYLDGRVTWQASQVEVNPPLDGRVMKSRGNGTLDLTMIDVKLNISDSGGFVTISESGFNTLGTGEKLTTIGNTKVSGWPVNMSVKSNHNFSDRYTLTSSGFHPIDALGVVTNTGVDLTARAEAVSPNNIKIGTDEIEIFGVPRPLRPSVRKHGNHSGGSATYNFCLVAVDSNGNRSLRSYTSIAATSVNTTLSASDFLRIEWPATPNASSYELYRSNPANLEYQGELVASGITGTTYDLTTNMAGVYTAYTTSLPSWNESTSIKLRSRVIKVNEVTFTDADTTPSVAKADDFVTANTGATSITTFDNGIAGQTISVRVNDANTTFVKGSTLSTVTGANILATNGRIYKFTLRGTIWYQIGNSETGYQAATSGSVNGSNLAFVFAVAPNVVVVDGVPKRKTQSDGTVNWTGTTTINLTVAPNYDIFAIG